MKISVAKLKKAGACENQVDLFAKLFGDKPVPVTLERCKEAAATELDLGWAARKLFSNSAFIAYDEARASAWKALYEARAVAWNACDEARVAAWKTYRETIAPEWKAYHEVTAAAWKTYRETVASAEKAYYEAIASAFYNDSKINRKG